MTDMAQAIIPKSDQLNSDDLIAGPITIRITGVAIKPGTEQPVAISFEGDNNKPWKPCKSMSRVLVAAWGADAGKYTDRCLTLYRDPTVKWAGMEVGGIRISHMTHITVPLVMALTATKGSRKLFTVQPLVMPVDVATLIKAYELAATATEWEAIETDRGAAWKKIPTDDKLTVKAASDAAKARIDATREAAP